MSAAQQTNYHFLDDIVLSLDDLSDGFGNPAAKAGQGFFHGESNSFQTLWLDLKFIIVHSFFCNKLEILYL